jgi:hypothetical protein
MGENANMQFLSSYYSLNEFAEFKKSFDKLYEDIKRISDELYYMRVRLCKMEDLYNGLEKQVKQQNETR